MACYQLDMTFCFAGYDRGWSFEFGWDSCGRWETKKEDRLPYLLLWSSWGLLILMGKHTIWIVKDGNEFRIFFLSPTILMCEREYSMQTRSIPCLLMPWFLALLGYNQPSYCLKDREALVFFEGFQLQWNLYIRSPLKMVWNGSW